MAPVRKASAPPGQRLYQDTTDYVLAGLVVEKASGRSVATAIDGDLWTPLGLTRFAYQDEQILPEPVAAPGEGANLPKGQTGPQSVAQLTDFDHPADPGHGLATIDVTQPYWYQWSIDGHGIPGEIVGYRSVVDIHPMRI